jgi:hypothetical protein
MDSSSSQLDNEGEKVEEPKNLTTFISDEELSDKEENVLKDDEKVEEPNDLMTFSSDEELSDKEENVVLPVVLKDDEKIEEPKSSMTFSSIEEVCSYYRRYAKQVGFGIAHRSSRKTKGIKSYVLLICTCGGDERATTSGVAKPIPTTNRTGCGARICARLCGDGT